jgi:hypothetical protein
MSFSNHSKLMGFVLDCCKEYLSCVSFHYRHAAARHILVRTFAPFVYHADQPAAAAPASGSPRSRVAVGMGGRFRGLVLAETARNASGAALPPWNGVRRQNEGPVAGALPGAGWLKNHVKQGNSMVDSVEMGKSGQNGGETRQALRKHLMSGAANLVLGGALMVSAAAHAASASHAGGKAERPPQSIAPLPMLPRLPLRRNRRATLW